MSEREPVGECYEFCARFIKGEGPCEFANEDLKCCIPENPLDEVVALEAFKERVLNAAYIEDCHRTGTHDPVHTVKRICEEQMADLAKRVCSVLFDVEFKTGAHHPVKGANNIPRKLRRGHEAWYDYYKAHDPVTAAILKHWERFGYEVKE